MGFKENKRQKFNNIITIQKIAYDIYIQNLKQEDFRLSYMNFLKLTKTTNYPNFNMYLEKSKIILRTEKIIKIKENIRKTIR